MKKIGFDFICKGHQHHTYMIGLFYYSICDTIYLDETSNLPSPFIVLLKNNQKFIYSKFITRVFFLIYFSLIKKEKVIVTGINNYFIPLLIPLSLINKIDIHLHGQIYLSYKRYKLIWKILSKIFKLVVSNPISNVPNYFFIEKDFSSFAFVKKKKKNNYCLMYGSNKEYIFDTQIHQKLKEKSYELIFLPAYKDYRSWEEILVEASKCYYGYLKLDERYNTVPSGRIGDLQVLNLIPLVDKSDQTTINILDKRKIHYQCI